MVERVCGFLVWVVWLLWVVVLAFNCVGCYWLFAIGAAVNGLVFMLVACGSYGCFS